MWETLAAIGIALVCLVVYIWINPYFYIKSKADLGEKRNDHETK